MINMEPQRNARQEMARERVSALIFPKLRDQVIEHVSAGREDGAARTLANLFLIFLTAEQSEDARDVEDAKWAKPLFEHHILKVRGRDILIPTLRQLPSEWHSAARQIAIDARWRGVTNES